MTQSILSERQKKFLKLFAAEKSLVKQFYLGGGTALAEYYLKHRLSEDLDFFSEAEFDIQGISVFLEKIKKILKFKKMDYQQSFNRNLFFLHFADEILKIEFTYYPFPRIKNTEKVNEITVDSLLDIAVNKIFTIYQKPRSRDFIDLYLLIRDKKVLLKDLIKKARIKFDSVIDPLQLARQMNMAVEVKDYPRMLTKLAVKEWQDFWLQEARGFKSQILKP